MENVEDMDSLIVILAMILVENSNPFVSTTLVAFSGLVHGMTVVHYCYSGHIGHSHDNCLLGNLCH